MARMYLFFVCVLFTKCISFCAAAISPNTGYDESLNTTILEEQFSEWLEGPKKVRLLYSLARDGPTSSTFHSLCDDRGPTITIIYNPQGSIYGGYTSMSWQYSSGNYYRDHSAFLFSLQKSWTWNPTKFPVSRPEYAIYNHYNYGPTFGNGHDLYTMSSGAMRKSDDQYAIHSTSFNNGYRMSGNTDIHNNVNTITNMEVYSIVDGSRPSGTTWRKEHPWSDELLKNLTKEIQEYQPLTTLAVPKANILLIGPVGSGKSSFFNTINSVFRGYVSSQALTGTSEHSVTTKFRIYPIKSTEHSKELNFLVHDTAGTEDTRNFEKDELDLFLDGNIPDGYQFNPSMRIVRNIPGFISNTSLNTSVHCIAIVLDGSQFEQMPSRPLKKLKFLKIKMHEKGIPQVVLLTHIDKACPHVEQNVTSVFKSDTIENLVEKVAEVIGLPRSHVLPVKNYEKEHELNRDVSILALLSLRQMLRYSNDYMYNFLGTNGKSVTPADVLPTVAVPRQTGRKRARPLPQTTAASSH